MSETVIRAAGLAKRFGTVSAVGGIDFEVRRGTVLGLLGGNGAGKTTTIAMLLGLILPSAGEARVLDCDPARDRRRLLPRVNFSSPYVELPKRLSVAENLSVFARLYGVEDVRGRIARLADELELGSLLKRQTGTLSSGEKTRVSLAKALVNEPEVLFLDEPTASLDPDTADWVRGYLERYRGERAKTIVMASHNMVEVERVCDAVIVMRGGRIADEGTPRELIARHGRRTLEEVFLAIARRPDAPPTLAAQ